MDTTHGLDPVPLATLRRAVDATNTADAAWVLVGAGVPVFPCAQASTRPLNESGPRGASTDPDRVAWWWSRYPTANLAIPTGSLSGLDVVEVHPGPGARSGFKTIRRAMHAGLVATPGLMVATPSGGLHLFFPRSPGAPQMSWDAPLSGIRFHGEGGYVPLPPSLVLRPDNVVARYRPVGPGDVPTGSVDAVGLRRLLGSPELQTQSGWRTRGPAAAPSAGRLEPARTAVRVARSVPTAPGGVRSLSRTDPGGSDRRPPEVVSL